ncbi:Probable RNA-directed DNA polymerase from transposon X-element [Eumeta japonica]|uniref:Probable RNA-directed DNA polymerase from transposon X-element n=1 Tax=Eumeta variegata TaxID=151549 RepID=A0A4C1TNQ9_EUMVA|nr:Probable RNA-directed DNA polymerase from transposon X-element [Eumeta japonica]
MRPDALIIRPKEKEKYSEILSRIKTAVPSEQVGNTVDKIRKTGARDMLITLSKGGDIYIASDHNAILWEISCDEKRERPNRQTNTTVGSKVKTFDPSTLIVAIDSKPIVAGPAEEMTTDLMKRVTHACNATELITEYKNARRSLNKAIKDSKRRCWEELINEVDKDPWGRPYKVVMTHLKSQPMFPPTYPQLLQKTFLTYASEKRLFLGSGKSNDWSCFQRKKPPEVPSSYRPLCMLDTASKIFERIILQRTEAAVEPLLTDNQYGFRKGRSTLDAINLVVNTAREAIAGTRWKGGTKKYCLVATLDIKNAFNSAN